MFDCAFVLLQFLDQQVNPLDGEGVETAAGKPAIAADFGIDRITPLAHGTHRLWIRREYYALSVINKSRGRIDDDYNNNSYVRFPTLIIWGVFLRPPKRFFDRIHCLEDSVTFRKRSPRPRAALAQLHRPFPSARAGCLHDLILDASVFHDRNNAHCLLKLLSGFGLKIKLGR
jgi:hypothetical protein